MKSLSEASNKTVCPKTPNTAFKMKDEHWKQSEGIKRADNGTIGESRTKAFLIDRFWILERSVDIEGADFLIQRKLRSHSILNDKPPRFGIVQSKFSQNERTYHKIKKEYVSDINGIPHMEFFLIVNIGYEDSQKMCFLTAKDIVENFSLNADNEYSISTKALLERYLVIDRKHILDYIERSIQCVDFYKNRMFIFNDISSFTPDLESIDPDFTFDIGSNDEKITEIFKQQKEDAYDFILTIEAIHRQLVEFVRQTNPIEACYIAESFNHYYKNLSVPKIFNRDFYYKSKTYFEQIENLRNDGILQSYLSLRKNILNKVNSFLRENLHNVNPDSRHLISIKYNIYDFSELIIKNEIVTYLGSIESYFEYLIQKEGEIKVSIWIGNELKNGMEPFVMNEVCLNDILNKIYDLKYNESSSHAY